MLEETLAEDKAADAKLSALAAAMMLCPSSSR